MTDISESAPTPERTAPMPEDQHEPYFTMGQRSDFLAANRGTRVARTGFVLLANANKGKGRRAGITVTKKIGNAVVRNRMKRRFRALLREVLPEHGLPDTDHVLIGRENGIERDYASLREELVAALTRVRDGKGDPPRGPRRGKGGPKGGSGPKREGGRRRGKGDAAGGGSGEGAPAAS